MTRVQQALPIDCPPILQHGGSIALNQAAIDHGIAPHEWLDLSTGITPYPWHPQATTNEQWPAELLHQLPDNHDGLLERATQYYGCSTLLEGAGSQAFIQCLPFLRCASKVAVPKYGYGEHKLRWQMAGHKVSDWDESQPLTLEKKLTKGEIDVLVVINPGNPTAVTFSPAQLLMWHELLCRKDGWLIVDEAFIDATPELSLAPFSPRLGLIVLRSLGKFFGLPGLRLGFAMAPASLLQKMRAVLGPWAVSSPARWFGQQALSDTAWQKRWQSLLPVKANQWQIDLQQALGAIPIFKVSHTPLFVSFQLSLEYAQGIFKSLAQQGILIRLLPAPPRHGWLRFGLPANATQQETLISALLALNIP